MEFLGETQVDDPVDLLLGVLAVVGVEGLVIIVLEMAPTLNFSHAAEAYGRFNGR